MSVTATLTRTGQITIPKWVREALGVEPGQRITFRKEKGKITLEREKTASEIAEEIDAMIPDEARESHMANYAGMTSAEMREKWAASEEGHADLQEEMERTL